MTTTTSTGTDINDDPQACRRAYQHMLTTVPGWKLLSSSKSNSSGSGQFKVAHRLKDNDAMLEFCGSSPPDSGKSWGHLLSLQETKKHAAMKVCAKNMYSHHAQRQDSC